MAEDDRILLVREAEDNQPQIPQIKILGSPSIICENKNCERPASFLFRYGTGPIAAYCEVHARQRAALFRMALPESPMSRIRIRWQELNSPGYGSWNWDVEGSPDRSHHG
jgi:hypothetical protein